MSSLVILHAVVYGLFALLAVIFPPADLPWAFVGGNLFVAALLSYCAWKHLCRFDPSIIERRIPPVLLITPLLIVAAYSQVSLYQEIQNPAVVEAHLRRIDMNWFGFQSTDVPGRFQSVLFTEILQFVYMTFYFVPLAVFAVLWRDGRRSRAAAYVLIVALGFYFTYGMYLLFPARSPYRLESYSGELEGMFLFQIVRDAIHALEVTQIDCFPSGHVLLSGFVAYVLAIERRLFAPAAVVWFVLIAVATIYLRYHYLIDVVVSLAILPLFWRLYHVLVRQTGKQEALRRREQAAAVATAPPVLEAE